MANHLPLPKKVRVAAALCEGNSIRSTERLTGVNRQTVQRLGVRLGKGCAAIHDELMRGLNVALLEVDEVWSFVGKKQRRRKPGDPRWMGDCYVYTALDATSKAIVSYAVGKRDVSTTDRFCRDLRERVLNRPQISSDGYVPYINAIDRHFGCEVDYAQLVKHYDGEPAKDAARRYSPGWVIGTTKEVIQGRPDAKRISTSYVERSNLTIRMQNRRFTRLTNGFSKLPVNHEAAVSLTLAYYNFCWVSGATRVSPAMGLGVTDHVWSVEELVTASLSGPDGAPAQAPPREPTAPESMRSRLRVLDGGLA